MIRKIWLTAALATSLGSMIPAHAGETCRMALLRVRSLEHALADNSDPWVRKHRTDLEYRLTTARGSATGACSATKAFSIPSARNLGIHEAIAPWRALIQREARRQGISPHLVAAIIWVESAGNPVATSVRGAQGLMQLMPPTARELGVRNSFDPAQNVSGGIRYLLRMLQRFDGDVRRALAAYNAGPERVMRGGRLPAETRAYVPKVLAAWRLLLREGS